MTDFQQVGPILTGAAAAVGTITIPECSWIAFDVSGLTSETVSITASVDGTNYNAAKCRPISMATGAVPASSDLTNGLFVLDCRPFYSVKLTKSAASETVLVRTGLGQ